MLEPTGTRDHARALYGIARCSQCGTPLLKIGTNYCCPNFPYSLTNTCDTQHINAEKLLHLVVGQLINRVINEQTTTQLVDAIQSEYGEKSRRAKDNLDRTEAAIMELNELREQVAHPVDQGDDTYSEVIDRVEDIDQQTVGLSYEARLFRKEIDAYDFVTDEVRIRTNAVDQATYLDGASPDDTRDLLTLFVKSVEVSNEHIVINYTDQVPHPPQSEENTADKLPLH